MLAQVGGPFDGGDKEADGNGNTQEPEKRKYPFADNDQS